MEKEIKKILNTLVSNGYESYLVGGYVRDYLLGIKSLDVDICTKALPKDIYKLFNINKNNYGSVNIKKGKYNIDITTFRKDSHYVNRKPTQVEYIDSLKEDLKRRDFTINAICMDINDKIIDLEGGVDDLNNRVINLIGDASRLEEDPLRILRAIRFSCTLDFTIAPALLDGLKKYAHLVGSLSKTRVREELDKILLSKNFSKGLELMKKLGILKILDIDYDNIIYVDDLLGMYSQLNFSNIPFTKIEKSTIIDIATVVSGNEINNKVLYKYGLYICSTAGKIIGISPREVTKLYNNLVLKDSKDLDISSEELINIFGSGKIIGIKRQEIIDLILEGKLKNNKEDIIAYLNKE